MAYAQWVQIKILPANLNVTIKNVVHEWGKFYSGDKDNEVDPSSINNTSIASGNAYTISACGRSDSPSGTQGSFDLYDDTTHIGTYSWDCPWGSKKNSSDWHPSADEHYIVQVTGANLDSGALGNVTLKVAKF
jgi:hypothetical protein